MRAMMKAMGQEVPEPKVVIEVNPRHEVIKGLANLKESDAELAAVVSEQLTDNALLAAGLLENPQQMVNRINDLLARVAK